MNILYFSWGENSKDDLAHTLLSLGHSVCTIRAAVHNYFENPSLSAILEKELSKKITILFSALITFHFFPRRLIRIRSNMYPGYMTVRTGRFILLQSETSATIFFCLTKKWFRQSVN